MNKKSISYEDVLYKRIAALARESIIITYKPSIEPSLHTYSPYSHGLTNDGSTKLGDLVRKYLVFYAYSEDEVVDKEKQGNLEDLEHAARMAIKLRFPKRKGVTNGIYGEAFIDLLLYLKYNNLRKFCLRTVLRQKTDNQEVKGFDALHMIIDGEKKNLFLGQAKLGQKAYCVKSIKKDIKKLDFLYTYDQLAFITDKTGYVSQEIKQELTKLNNLFFEMEDKDMSVRKTQLRKFLRVNNYNIIIPCLLAYENADTYLDFNNKIMDEVKYIISKLDDCKANLELYNYEIVFLVFPLNNIKHFRDAVGLDDE